MAISTKRKGSREGLTGDKYFNLIEHAADGIAILQDGVFKLVNTALARISGYDKEELLGMPFTNLLTPESQKLTMARYQARLAGKKVPPIYEIKAVTKDGEVRDIEVNAALTEYEGGVADEVIVRDITERKQAEEALRQSQNNLRTYLESAPDAVYINDLRGTFLYGNKKAEELTGYKREELVGKSFLRLNLLPAKHLAKAGRLLALNATGRPTGPDEFELIRKGGSRIWVEINTTPIKQEGKVVVLGFVRDISERKQAEQVLERQQAYFQQLFDNSPEAIVLLDDTNRIVNTNKGFETLFGYPIEEVKGRPIREVTVPEDRIEEASALGQAILNGKAIRKETVRKRKDGSLVDVSILGYPIHFDNKAVGVYLIYSDITERKQAEEALRESQKFSSSLLESSPNPISVINPDTSVRYVNPALEKLTGFTLAEIAGRKAPYPWWPEGKRRKIAAALKDAMAHGGRRTERNFQKKKGERFWVALNSAPVVHEGKPIYFLINWLDITERKQAEEALADEATRRRILIDQSRDGIVILDQNGKVYEANQRFAEMLGYSPEEAAELHVWDWDTQWTREQLLEMVRSVDAAGAHFETYHRRKDGTTIDVEISTNGAVCAGQKLVFCVCRDITERKQAEEKLRLLGSVTQQVSDATIVTDLDFKVTYINKAAQDLLGYSAEEMLGKHMGGFNAEPLPESLEQEIEQTVSSGKLWVGTLEKRRKDGSTFLGECHISPLYDKQGQISSYIDVMRDVTEHKRMEKKIQQQNEFLNNILNSLTHPFYVIDANDYTVKMANLAAGLGNLSENPTCYALTHKKDKPCRGAEHICPLEEVKKTKKPIVVEHIHYDEDGNVRNIEVHGYPIFDTEGNVVQMIEYSLDISERKQAEDALRESEERYRAVIEGAHDMIQSVALDGSIIFVNQAWLDALGYTKAELPSLNLFEIIHPDSQSHCQELFAKVMSGEPVHGVQATFLTKDGRKILVEGNAAPRYIGGKVVATQGIFHDITERKQMEQQIQEKNEQLDAQNEELRAINEELRATEQQVQENNEQLDAQNEELRAVNEELQATEEELQQSQEKLERMFESVTDGIVVANLDGTILKVNEKAVQMHGFASEEEMLGKNALELAGPGDHEKIASNMRKALKEGLIISQEYTLLRADGSEFPGELSTSALKDASGKVIGHVTIARDITERKQTEELLKTVANSSPVGIYIVQGGKFQRTNPQFQKLTGYTKDELLGMDSLALILDEDRDMVRKKAVKMLKGKSFSPYQFRVVNKTGETRWVMETVTSIQYRGRRAILGNDMDITERRQAEEKEEQLQQELNLASRLASIGQMASGVAHEINNPLTGVIGFSHLMMSRNDIPNDMKQDLEVINSEARRVAKIVENLLTFAHQRKTGREYMDINSIIARVLELRSYEMKVNNIEVETQLAPDLPYTMADAGQLQQVLLNIVLNAEHFITTAHNKGKLLVKTERIDDNIRASFTDDGSGISKKNLDKIFNPFFTTKEVGNGTGLGLSICHGIITQHKGRIYAQSELGKGATFVVELPIVDEPTQAGQAEVTKDEPEKPRGAKVLVVDDELAILAFLRRLLTEWGHSVETINNANAALDRIKTERYSLILLDIKLPGMSGVELYRHIEAIAPALTRRVMFITGDILETATRDFLDRTKVPHITKPIDIELLKKTVSHALNQTHVAATTPG